MTTRQRRNIRNAYDDVPLIWEILFYKPYKKELSGHPIQKNKIPDFRIKRAAFIVKKYSEKKLDTARIMSEYGYATFDLPPEAQDEHTTITKRVFFCRCTECLKVFVRFRCPSTKCHYCKKDARHKKLAEQQRLRRTLKKGIAPRYCENPYCRKLLPHQENRNEKGEMKQYYCDVKCKQKAYRLRKKEMS
jgi:hypothetical protein